MLRRDIDTLAGYYLVTVISDALSLYTVTKPAVAVAAPEPAADSILPIPSNSPVQALHFHS